jgi:hypothetical protein
LLALVVAPASDLVPRNLILLRAASRWGESTGLWVDTPTLAKTLTTNEQVNTHTQHLLLPSLTVTSSQLRVSTPLPLLSCCIPGLGPKGLWHNCMVPVNLPGIFLLRVTLASGETLPSRTFHVKFHCQSAVSTRCPTTLQHPLEKQVMSSRTYKDQFFFGSRVTHFSRDPSQSSTGSYVSFFQRSHTQEHYHQWTTLRP